MARLRNASFSAAAREDDSGNATEACDSMTDGDIPIAFMAALCRCYERLRNGLISSLIATQRYRSEARCSERVLWSDLLGPLL
jgi:hypothetical protein